MLIQRLPTSVAGFFTLTTSFATETRLSMQQVTDEIRRHLPGQGEARRLFHGRGRCFDGYQDLLIDAYGPLLWVTLFAERSKAWCDQLVTVLRELIPDARAIVLQRRDQPEEPIVTLWGELVDEPMAIEAGLRYALRPNQGVNNGFFIDMATGRALVRERAAGKRVLNLFAYTCSFSVAAVAGGAQGVVNVDMNRGALATGRRNHLLNGQDLRGVSFLPHELFRSFSRLRRLAPFDLLICDPPYAQGKSFTAEVHWPRLIRRLGALLSAQGEVIACLNAPHLGPDFLREQFAEHLPQLREAVCLSAGEDFPEADPDRGLAVLHYARRSSDG